MTVAVLIPNDAEKDMVASVTLGCGAPYRMVRRETEVAYLYNSDDVEQIHHQISQHIAGVYRKIRGHCYFLKLHGYFNDYVKVISEDAWIKLNMSK